MGQIADDMINGCACQLCDQYFTKDGETLYEHGYEVVCWGCWATLTEEEKKFHRKAQADTL